MLMTDLWLIQRRRGERIRSPLHLFLSLHTFRDSLARTASASQCCLGAPVYVSSIMHRTKWLSPTAQCQNERTAKDVERSWNGISCAVQVERTSLVISWGYEVLRQTNHEQETVNRKTNSEAKQKQNKITFRWSSNKKTKGRKTIKVEASLNVKCKTKNKL